MRMPAEGEVWGVRGEPATWRHVYAVWVTDTTTMVTYGEFGGPDVSITAYAWDVWVKEKQAWLVYSECNMSSFQQSFLAEVCSITREHLYALKTGKDSDTGGLGLKILEHCLAMSIQPNQLSELYDKLHRAGANT